MPKLIYLEPDEEITDVIDKISKTDDKSVSLVIPRGSTLANSVVNLKLLAKRSKSLGKDVALVTNDKIAKNLASQIGLAVFGSINDAKAGAPIEVEEEIPVSKKPEPVEEIDGVKVHQYDRSGETDIEPDVEEVSEPIEEEIADEPEVIEAVKDADDSTALNNSQIDTEENNFEKYEEPDEKPEGKNDFKLIKRPMIKSEGARMESHNLNPQPVFDKMRQAKKRKKIIIWSIVGAVAVLIVVGLFLTLPKAKALVSVVSEPFKSEADITVNKDVTAIDAGNATIPGKLVTKEEEIDKPFAASGSKNIGAKAKGKITAYNNWDSAAISLPAGTKFSASGIEFLSTAAATIPGATVVLQGGQLVITASGTADVSVEATAVGEESNIKPSDFVITSLPKVQQPKIYGKSTSAMSGGTNQIVKIVTAKDITDAKASAERELKEKLTNAIKAEIGANVKLLDSAITSSVVTESASAKADDQVDNFNYKMKLKVDALTFSEDDFKSLLLESAKGKIDQNKEIVPMPPVEDQENNEGISYEVSGSNLANGTISLKGKFEGYIADKIDPAVLKSEIKGKTIKTATTKITAHQGVLSVDITTEPNFMRSIPLLDRRISIEFNYRSK